MRQLTTLIVSIILCSVAGQSAAQFREEIEVYEKKDEKGVPSYTNIPSEGARPVTVPPTNLSDSVQVKPLAPAPSDPEAQQSAPEPGTPEYEQKVQRELEEYRQEQLEIRRERHGETRHKVGHDAGAQRREVGDSDGSR